MKFAQFLAAGIALASAAAFAGGDKQGQRTQSSEPQNTQAPSDQQAQMSQGQGAQQDQETVKQAQEKLSSLGHDAGPADGIVGPKTQAAVKEFQQSKGLQASGRLDNQTLAALQSGEGASSPRSSSGQPSGQSMSSQPSGSTSTPSASPSGNEQSKKY